MDPRKPILLAVVVGVLGASALADDRQVQVRIEDETVPAGGVVQLKLDRYEVTPISGGRPGFQYEASLFEDFVGFGMFAPTGELAGAAVIDGDRADISFVTTQTPPDDLPLLTVALRVRADARRGSRTSVSLDRSSIWWPPSGAALTTRVDSGEITVGGSLAVSGVYPGQGSFPAGTVVTVRGIGFNRETRLRVEDVEIGSVRFVSDTEMQFTLARTVDMTGKRLRLDNRDGSRVFYYSYTHGISAATSSRALLAATVPIFSGRLRSVAVFGALPPMTVNEYAAVALLNPTLSAADVRITLYSSAGALLDESSVSLPKGHRVALELSELFGGVPPPQGSWIRVSSSRPIHISRLMCDERTWTVTPALASQAAR
jgi:hypothetical protein